MAPHTKLCGLCRTPFKAVRSTAKYCSATCRKRASRGHVTLRGAQPPRHANEALSESLRPIKGPSGDPSDPEYIHSEWSGRTYPRTYAEHGLPYPAHLKARRGRPATLPI